MTGQEAPRRDWSKAWNDASASVTNWTMLGGLITVTAVVLRSAADSWQDKLTEAITWATLGAIAGGLLGFVFTLLSSRPRSARGTLVGRQGLRDQLLRAVAASYEEQLWELLPTRERIPVEFRAFAMVAPVADFAGRISARTDIEKAYLQSCTEDQNETAGPGRLLVVGAPGSGKSVALLQIAKMLAERAASNPQHAVPVLFSLGGWTLADESLREWLTNSLTRPSGLLAGQPDLARAWVDDGVIAPILDGFDEVINEHARANCRDAINKFTLQQPATPVVVASRTFDYKAIAEGGAKSGRLAMNAAIELQNLSINQVVSYLEQEVGARDEVWRQRVVPLLQMAHEQPEHPVIELLRLPLWLSFVERCGNRFDRLSRASTRQQGVDALLEGFLSTTESEDRKHLAAIAGFLADARTPNRTTFYAEDLTGGRVPISAQLAVAAGILVLAFSSLWVWSVMTDAKVTGSLGSAFAVCAVSSLIVYLSPDARPTLTELRWPDFGGLVREANSLVPIALASGLLIFVFLSFFRTLGESLAIALRILAYGFIPLLVAGVLAPSWVIIRAQAPDSGRSGSLRSALVRVTVYFSVVLLFFWLVSMRFEVGLGAAMVTLPFGMALAMDEGGWYMINQHLVRRRAHHLGLLPRGLRAFLDRTTTLRVLRQVGSGHQFRHRELLEYLMRESPSPGLADLREATTKRERPAPTA